MTTEWGTFKRVIVIIVVLALTGLFLYAVRPLVRPLILAALLGYTLNSLVRYLQARTRLQRKWAVVMVYFLFLALFIATPGTLVPVLIGQADTLAAELLRVETQLNTFLANPVAVLGRTIYLEQLWADFVGLLAESLTPVTADALRVLEITSTSLIWLVLILVSTYYLMLDWEGLRDWVIGLVPDKDQADMYRLLEEIDGAWRAYMRGTLALMFLMGLFFIAVGLIIGLPGAVALGLLTGFLSMIPEIGPLIAGTLAVLVAFFEGSNFLAISNFWFAALVGGIYLVVMQIKSLWLRPIVMGRFMHMNTGLVFVAIIGAALLYGILAAIIILPLLATVGILGRYVRCRLLNLDPWPAFSATAAGVTVTEAYELPLPEAATEQQ